MGACCAKKKLAGPKLVRESDVPGPRAAKINTQNIGTSLDDNELRAVFREFDVDGDGAIQEHELGLVMIKMGQNPDYEDVKAMFQSADKNGDGKIDFEEFVAIAKANPLTETLTGLFRELDVDKDGYITKMEMKKGLEKMGYNMTDLQVETIFDKMDADQDGQITCDEFFAIMATKTQQAAPINSQNQQQQPIAA